MRTTPKPAINIAEVFPELAAKAKQTVRLHPRRGPEPGIRESKMGGSFLWPADEPWPVCDDPSEYDLSYYPQPELASENDLSKRNDFLVGVLQLRADDFPELPFPGNTDIFQLLWCPRDHNKGCPTCKVFWRKESEIIKPLYQAPSPKYPELNYLLIPCCVHPERVEEYPDYFELPEFLRSKIDAWDGPGEDEKYGSQLSTAPGTKLGGWVDWIQFPVTPTCKCGREMEHLLTIASAEYGAERWIPLEDQPIVANDSYEEEEVIWRPANIMLGDVGSIYVFICRECEGWPIDWVFQCS